ncbi:hypothetical protein SPFL3102_00456 [Sporomusaceae bacterium FL31]|nr:hypothetical protein SPFL3101_01616 [Sporomusaceae bacterium FL31]GCE32660.1 hypothetical protein SPFL3102_00456 [Sporomusaceae bacterium]
MNIRTELHHLIDQLTDQQLTAAKEALNRVIQGRENIPVCDLGSAEDIASLYKTVTYEDKDKNQ